MHGLVCVDHVAQLCPQNCGYSLPYVYLTNPPRVFIVLLSRLQTCMELHVHSLTSAQLLVTCAFLLHTKLFCFGVHGMALNIGPLNIGTVRADLDIMPGTLNDSNGRTKHSWPIRCNRTATCYAHVHKMGDLVSIDHSMSAHR